MSQDDVSPELLAAFDAMWALVDFNPDGYKEFPMPPPADFGPRAKPTDEQLARRFAHHPPKDDQVQRYGQVRSTLLQAAKDCVAITPVSPEQTRAINALHEAMMLFNAAIACNE